MYGTSILQTTDARPTFRTVTPLYQKTLLRGKLQALLAAVTGRSTHLAAIDELTKGQAVHNQRHLGSKVVRIADIQASEDRSGDFDRSFNPLETHTKSRWLSIAAARLERHRHAGGGPDQGRRGLRRARRPPSDLRSQGPGRGLHRRPRDGLGACELMLQE